MSKTWTLADLTARVIAFRDAREWKQFHTPKDLALNLAIESAEVMQLLQWKNGAELDAHLARHREELADELADVLHTVLLLAESQQIDLGNAFVKKMEKNEAKYPVEKARGKSTKWHRL
jgi:NTP pyrophosphatase (non-canonical NTP hydrolase)